LNERWSDVGPFRKEEATEFASQAGFLLLPYREYDGCIWKHRTGQYGVYYTTLHYLPTYLPTLLRTGVKKVPRCVVALASPPGAAIQQHHREEARCNVMAQLRADDWAMHIDTIAVR
jgi:hypothetical protein